MKAHDGCDSAEDAETENANERCLFFARSLDLEKRGDRQEKDPDIHEYADGAGGVEQGGVVDATAVDFAGEVPHLMERYTLCESAYHADGTERREKADRTFTENLESLARS